MSAIAREAGALLMHHFHQHLKIEYKGDADLVTAADRAAEVLIRERIRQQWPSHDVLGEEQGLSDQGSEYRWYVDPLDGTTNFAHGFPVFCVSIGLEYQPLSSREPGRRIAAVIYDPTRDELFSAEQGRGARLNGESIHVSKTATLKECSSGHGLSQPQAAQESEYLFLSPDHAAFPRSAKGGIRRAGFVQRSERAL